MVVAAGLKRVLQNSEIVIANESSSEAISNLVKIISVRLLHLDKSGFAMTYATDP
jgi:hypothetical protein